MNIRILTIFFLIGISAMIPYVLAASDDRPDAYVRWVEDSYPSTDTGLVRVVDHYMNIDSEKVENFHVDVYSEENIDEGIKLTVTETNVDTGIFEGTVFFSETEESSGHRLHVAEGDTVSVEYTYSTVPGSDALEDMIILGHEIIIKNPPGVEQGIVETIPVETNQEISTITPPVGQDYDGYYVMIFIGGIVAVIIVVLIRKYRT